MLFISSSLSLSSTLLGLRLGGPSAVRHTALADIRQGIMADVCALRPSGLEEASPEIKSQFREALEMTTPNSSISLRAGLEETEFLLSLKKRLKTDGRLVPASYQVYKYPKSGRTSSRYTPKISFANKKLIFPPYFRTDSTSIQIFRDEKERYLLLQDPHQPDNLVIFEQRFLKESSGSQILSAATGRILLKTDQEWRHLSKIPEFKRFYERLHRKMVRKVQKILGIGKMQISLDHHGILSFKSPPTYVNYREGSETNWRQVVETSTDQLLMTLRRRNIPDEIEVAYGDEKTQTAFVIKGDGTNARYFNLEAIVMALHRIGLPAPAQLRNLLAQGTVVPRPKKAQYMVNRTKDPPEVRRAEDVPVTELNQWEVLNLKEPDIPTAGLEEWQTLFSAADNIVGSVADQVNSGLERLAAERSG